MLGISINSFFSKAKKLSVTPRTKRLVSGLQSIAERNASKNISDDKAAELMRKLLFKNGFSPADVDLALMQAQQTTAFGESFNPTAALEKELSPEKLFAMPKQPTVMPKQLKGKKPSLNAFEKAALQGLGFADGKQQAKGLSDLDLVHEKDNLFSFAKKKGVKRKKMDALFKKILWG